MSKSLNVAEKPSVAKKIIKILNHKNKIQEKLSWSNFNKVVEFTYKGKIMIFTSIIGHLIDLDFSKRKKKWDAVNPMDLFKIPLEKQISKGKYGLYKNLKFYAQKCDELILWLDCDREGENIAFEVIQICQETRPQIHCLRAKFNSLIAHQIYKAINNLTIPNKNHSDAVWIRREIDLRIGAAFTRFQTMYLQKSFKVKTVSYGPCQFPTLGFIVEQWRRSQNFQAEKFWFIRVELQYIINKDVFKSKKIQNCTFCWHRQYLFDKIPVLALYELCLLNPIAIVISIVSQSKEKMKPFPLETIEFTKHATHYLKMSSKQAMDAAEKLYQFGYISYPRTETNVFPDDFDHQQFIITQKKNPINQISIYAKKLLEGKYKPPRNGGKKDKGHLPIHPIGIPKNLQFDSYEERVYEYIVRHYLASISDNAKGEEISIFINISSEKFFTKGTYISALNWLEIYHWEKWNDKQIPDLLVNQTFQPSNITFNEGLTSSPKCLTETELITKMTKNGIGTDATTPTHIETILLRNYARKDKESRFRPQPLGIGLCLGYENMINTYGKYLSKPILRRDMEKAIVKISQGRKDKDIFLNECLTKIRMIFQQVLEQSSKLNHFLIGYISKKKLENIGYIYFWNFSICGKCKKKMHLKHENEERNSQLRTFLICTNCRLHNKKWFFLIPSTESKIETSKQFCSFCNYQILKFINKNKKHILVCPYCYNNPLTEEKIYKRNFPCFKYKTKYHFISRKNFKTIQKCPICKKKYLKLKKNRNSIWISCTGWPICHYKQNLPVCRITKIETEHKCSKCRAKKLTFQFKNNVVNFLNYLI